MLRDYLIPALKREFPEWEIIFDHPPQPIATFPARQETVGRVMVYDHGDEATVLAEHISHAHFNPYDETLKEADRNEWITQTVINFLKALFSDRVLLHVRLDGRGGGWEEFDPHQAPVQLSASSRYYLWSGPYRPFN